MNTVAITMLSMICAEFCGDLGLRRLGSTKILRL